MKNQTNPPEPIGPPNITVNGHPRTFTDILREQDHRRGIAPIPLEPDLLLKRIRAGGFSGDYLAEAFLSAYRRKPFRRSLGDITNLDPENFRVFHQILHMRLVSGWDDDVLWQLEKQIKAIQQAQQRGVPGD